MKGYTLVALSTWLGAAPMALAAPGTPADGPYTFTGTATLMSGPSTCIGSSPATIAGDAVSSGHGRSYYLHIRASSATYGFGAQLKSYYGGPVVLLGKQVDGSLSYLLLPQTSPLQGIFASVSQRAGSGFTETLTIVTGELTGSGTGKCRIGLSLTMVPGVSKPLLKLFKGVL